MKYIEGKYVSEKTLINALKGLFEENIFWDLAFQATTWLNQEIDQPIPSLCPCGKIYKVWLTKNNIVDDIENNSQLGICIKYHFKDKVSSFNHISQKAEQNSLIHYGLMQFLNVLYFEEVKSPKIKKKVSENEKQFMNDRICDIPVVKRSDFVFYSQRENKQII